MKNEEYHVKQHPTSGWQVIKTGNVRATRVFDTKEEAEQYVEELASDSEVISDNQSTNENNDVIEDKETDSLDNITIIGGKVVYDAYKEEKETVEEDTMDSVIDYNIAGLSINQSVEGLPNIPIPIIPARSHFFGRLFKKVFRKKK
jgi:hypothetical protein